MSMDTAAGWIGSLFVAAVFFSAPLFLGAAPGLLLWSWGRRRWGGWFGALGAIPPGTFIAYSGAQAIASDADLFVTMIATAALSFVFAAPSFVVGMLIALCLGRPKTDAVGHAND